jgi:hypothetical protein
LLILQYLISDPYIGKGRERESFTSHQKIG